MKDRRGKYYLGRVMVRGVSARDKLHEAILSPTVVRSRKFLWTFIDSTRLRGPDGSDFFFGKLAKFRPEGEIQVIDPEKRREIILNQANLRMALSPFVYLPEYSGIAYLHVWNQIEQPAFELRFSQLIKETCDPFFFQCQIRPVSDLRQFEVRLSRLDGIRRITAKVHPPNPLFGPLWGPLKGYLEKRRSEELKVEETGSSSTPLESKLPEHVRGVLDSGGQYAPEEDVDITDAALLMAADGYGTGTVEGDEKGAEVVIRTTDTIVSFLFDKEPDAQGLYAEAKQFFRRVNDDRGLEH